jgi:hypothetical protein
LKGRPDEYGDPDRAWPGRNAKAIWQDLVNDHGFRGAYQSVKRFVGKPLGAKTPEARVVTAGSQFRRKTVQIEKTSNRA